MTLTAAELDRVAALIAAGRLDVAAAGASARPDPGRVSSYRTLLERRRIAVMPSRG